MKKEDPKLIEAFLSQNPDIRYRNGDWYLAYTLTDGRKVMHMTCSLKQFEQFKREYNSLKQRMIRAFRVLTGSC